MIYFAQPVDGGPVKIGCSQNVQARISQLESHYGKPLALLATMPGGRDEEQEIHRRFAHLRFGKKEQFRPEADLMEFIGKPLLVGANPGAVEALESVENNHTTPTQIRLTARDKANLEQIRQWYGLPSLAAAIRFCLNYVYSLGPPTTRVPFEFDQDDQD